MNLERKIADKLFDIFYLDTMKYGVQIEDGSYRYIEGSVSPMLIQDSIEKKGSMLVYQELPVFKNSLVKWICLDVDIEKDAKGEDEALFLAVKETSLNVEKHLIELDIPHVIEFSGRRGFHLWVFFEEPVDKAEGYKLVKLVFNRLKNKLPKEINIDLFPQTPIRREKSKGVGKGVKLPLSKHRRSGFYALLLTDLFSFNSVDKLGALSSANLENQINILDNIIPLKKDKLSKIFEQHKIEIDEIISNTSFLQNYKVDSYIVGDTSLEDILKDLSRCDNIKTILDGYQKGLSEKERNKLVGLLINLRKKDDKEFGYNLLLELFSNITGYDEQKTRAKLEGLRYFQPVSCAVLGKCSQCKQDCNLKSPIELIPNVEVSEAHKVNLLNFNQNYFERIRNSLYSYSLRNDEVPLYPHLKKLKGIKGDEVEQYVQDILKGGRISNFRKYRFDRREKKKIRYLYNIDPLNNVVSTYFAFLLNSFFYSEMSNNSYGYEFSKSLYKGNLYTNWFINWGKYTREVEKVLFNNCYSDYYIIKLDIKSFYDKVDLERLRIKLFEEAPNTVKQRFEQLSVEEKEAYRHLINYLIDISIKTTGEDHAGLPQGPAYARYLAEIYLLGLDKLIENDFLTDPKREFYLRFVDDIFIFVENKERANLLYGKIESWLSTNSLEVNTEKTAVVNVEEFVESGAYTRFKDDQKYDINYANKNKHIVSEVQINKALAKLRELADDADFGLKDNLRFFYSQFKDDKVLRALKKKLAPKVALSKDGRGALYLLFFQDLFSSEKKIFLELSNSVGKMEGLALTHYLQALLMYIEDDSFVFYLKSFVENCLTKLNLSRADKLLLTTLILKNDMEIPSVIDNDIIIEAIDQPNLKLSNQIWSLYRDSLQQITNPLEYFNNVKKIIDDHEFELQFLKDFADHVFTRISEWEDKETCEILTVEANLITYYHVISFLTLFVTPGKENAIWEILLEYSTKKGVIGYKEEHQWLDKVNSFRLQDFTVAYYTLLFSEKGNDKLSKIQCPNKFLEHYRNILTIVMYASDKSENQKDFKMKLEEKVDDNEKSELQKWVANKYSTLYPNDSKIFLKNISSNGLIVLKCENKFFVKNANNENLTTKYDYLGNDCVKDIDERVYELSDLTSLFDSFKTLNNLSDFLSKLNEVFIEHRNFKLAYGHYPLFYNGYNSVGKYLPAVPYYSDFAKVSDYQGDAIEWGSRTYLRFIFNFLASKLPLENLRINREVNEFNFAADKLNERFFITTNLFSDSEFEFKFLANFCEHSDRFDNVNDFQYAWSKALYYYLLNEKSDRVIADFLKIHFEHYNHADIDVFWGVHSDMVVSKDNFLAFRNTLTESVRTFQRQITSFDLDFVKVILEVELNCFDDLEIEISEFKNVDLSLKKEKDYSGDNGEVTHVLIGGKSFDIVKLYEPKNKSFINLEEDDLVKLDVSEFVFAKIETDEVLLLHVPIYLEKCYNRVFERHKLAKSFNSEPIRYKRLNGLFSDESIARAERSIDSFENKISLINKLRMHTGFGNDIVIHNLKLWLTLFNEKLFSSVTGFEKVARKPGFIDKVHACILKVLNVHSCIDESSRVDFTSKIDDLVRNGKFIISLKHPGRDQNGLNQILTTAERQRKINFEGNFTDFLNDNFNLKDIYIVSDIFISGIQTEKAFKHYLSDINCENDETEYKAREYDIKYFSVPADKIETLKCNLKRIESITFIAPFISERFSNEIESKINSLGIIARVNCVTSGSLRKDSECFFKNAQILNREEHELFKGLFSHKELMSKLFNFNSKNWNHHLESINDFNIVLRPQSLPAKHFKPFAWRVINGEPLLKYRKNWGA